MRYFYDTEFIEDGKTMDLISIGMVSEDGRECYAQNADCDFNEASPWVQDNVFPHLLTFDMEAYAPILKDDCLQSPWYRHHVIGDVLKEFTKGDDKREFWGYYADYDHVVLCHLYGTMMELPAGWPMFTMDIKQMCVKLGDPKLPEQGKGEHHALADARWNKQAYEFLKAYPNERIKAMALRSAAEGGA